MFNNIHRRLVILNATVFLLILAVLSVLLYIHMQFRLIHSMDEILNQEEKRIQSFHNLSELLRSDHPDPEQDERTTYLFWSADGQLIGQLPKQSFPLDEVSQFKATLDEMTLRTVYTGNHSFRILQFPYQNQKSGFVASITLVRNLEDVDETLHSLLWDIASGIITGVVISIFAGLFLAGRALIPIRKAWEKQQRFVADASHELRTPTAVVHAQTELLLRHPAHSIEQESPHIAVILKESKRMSKLLDNLLTLARSDSNQLEIQSSVITLDSLLRELSERFQLLASTKGITITTKLQEPLSLWGDEGKIRQLLIILLDNAMKYTPSSGHIVIAGRYQANFVHISVTDSGCGIAKDDLPHVFERFYRGDKVRSRTEGGTGLGLSIAQWIVEAHGGDIRVDSEINKGTKVELLFPRKKRGMAERGKERED